MVDIVNRSGLDVLPNEYYQGIYDSQTDMFYLAEMFNRILKHTQNDTIFSYQFILDKMLQVDKLQRFKNFREIREVIERKDFSVLEINEEDKKIYQNYSNAIYYNLSCFTGEKNFRSDIVEFKYKVKELIEKNCFEDFIYNNSEVINTVVLGGYKYKTKNHIELGIIKQFYYWYSELAEKSQELVLRNMIYKLSSIREEIEEDLPF